MVLKTKKIVEQDNQLVFKTDLIGEDDVDKKLLTELESNRNPAIEKIIEGLVISEANDLREKYQPTWEFQCKKSEGEASYFIHLRKSK